MKITSRILEFIFVFFYLFIALPVGADDSSSNLREQFIAAIKDASVPQQKDVNNRLISISDNEPGLQWKSVAEKKQLLVVTFQSKKNYTDYYPEKGKTGKLPDDNHTVIWVTTVPELQTFCSSLNTLSDDKLSLRLKQYLGLDPDRIYDVLIELWVDRNDLFRPCADPETNDKQCDLTYKGTPAVPRVCDYKRFFLDLYEKSYQEKGAPWTRLGYTYDWGNGNRAFGASEFLLAPGSAYEVRSVSTVHDYCIKK